MEGHLNLRLQSSKWTVNIVLCELSYTDKLICPTGNFWISSFENIEIFLKKAADASLLSADWFNFKFWSIKRCFKEGLEQGTTQC